MIVLKDLKERSNNVQEQHIIAKSSHHQDKSTKIVVKHAHTAQKKTKEKKIQTEKEKNRTAF